MSDWTLLHENIERSFKVYEQHPTGMYSYVLSYPQAKVVATLTADLAQAQQDAQSLRDYIAARTTPRQGIEPQYDQSDADAFYLADENHKLRAELAEAEKARLDQIRVKVADSQPPLDRPMERLLLEDLAFLLAYATRAETAQNVVQGALDRWIIEADADRVEAARTALQDAATDAETFGLMTGSQIAEWLRYRTE